MAIEENENINQEIVKETEADLPSISVSNKFESMADKISDEDISILIQYVPTIDIGGDTRALHDRIYDEILPKFVGSKTLTDKEKTDRVIKIAYLFGLDTQAPLWESVDDKFGSMTIEFSKQLAKEYDCMAPSEKALVQVAANAYTRVMEYSNTLEACRNKSVNTNLIGYYSMIGKELDRANRQFISAMTILKQLRTPPLKINVIAKTAFIAKNQQLNVIQCNNENIKPK